MPWPIPTLTPIQRPQPISLATWLPILFAVAATVAAAVLMLWPHGKSTQTAAFWVLLIGAPACACGLLAGWRLNRWEGEQVAAEESERERDRVELLWRDWCRRHLSVAHAEAFLPQAIEVAALADRDADVPVNLSRSIGFDWAKNTPREHKCQVLLDRVAAGFNDRLKELREVEVMLVLDDRSFVGQDVWKSEVKRVFGKVMEGVEVDVDVVFGLDCAAWVAENIDSVDAPAKLVIAAQLWHGNDDHTFSEGAAAVLFEPRTASIGQRANLSAPVEGHVLRPMTTGDETLKTDLSQLAAMQVTPDKLTHVWFAGCREPLTVAATASLDSLQKETPVARLIDHVTGNPGPVSGWIALAIALESGRQNPGLQLVASHETGSDQTQLYIVAPGRFEGN